MPEIRALAATLLVASFLLAAGCGSINLGEIDETPDAREVKPGPGILDAEDGEPALTWTLGQSNEAPPEGPELDEKAEFEQFKIWNDLRRNHPDSEEYREFRQWLEYREFKQSE